MRHTTHFVTAAILFVALFPASLHAAEAANSPDLAPLLSRHGLQPRSVTLEIRDASAADTAPALLSWEAKTALNPASTIKVLTTAAALDQLGPSYRFKTVVYTAGSRSGGVLTGDLYVKGYGDPSMVSEQLWRLVMDLRDRGLKEVRGDLVGDDTFLKSTTWRRDFTRGMSSNSANGALSLNYNHIQIWVRPGAAVGSAPTVTIDPPIAGDSAWSIMTVDNRARTVGGNDNVLAIDIDERGPKGLTLTVAGKIGVNAGNIQAYRSMPRPTPYFLAAFRYLFESVGGKITGASRTGALPEGSKLFYEKESEAFLSQVLILLNKYSNNFIAEQLVMGMGAQRFADAPSTGGVYETGIDALKDYLRRTGGDPSAIRSGSGLSHENRISAADLSRVLVRAMRDSRIGPEMVASLSIFGSDGTTKRRPGLGQLGATIRAKTGSIDNVSALAGYILPNADEADSGNFKSRPLAFAILVNQPGVTPEAMKAFQNDAIALALQHWKQGE